MNLIDCFDRTVIVNLPERRDRRRQTVAEFRRAGLPMPPGRVVFHPAARPPHAAGFPSVGALGNFLSHLEVIRQARRDGLRNVLILEDDIALPQNFAHIALPALRALQTLRWDIAYLGHSAHIGEAESPLLRLDRWVEPLTHFQAFNASVFDRFLRFLEELQQRPPGHPDGGPMFYSAAVNFFRQANPDVVTLFAVPSLGWQRCSRTDLHPLGLCDRIPGARGLLAAARGCRNALRRAIPAAHQHSATRRAGPPAANATLPARSGGLPTRTGDNRCNQWTPSE